LGSMVTVVHGRNTRGEAIEGRSPLGAGKEAA